MTYYIDPFGCVKNQVDAENMMASLNMAGWAAAENADDADLIIVNSCGFIESAKRESINAVLSWRKLYPKKKILLSGCLAQRYAKDLAADLREADGFFGTDDLSGIVKAAEAAVKPARSAVRVKAAHVSADRGIGDAGPAIGAAHSGIEGHRAEGSRPLLSLPGSAYVKISEGCDNHCSFCAIPLIRGGLKSRKVKEIVEECKTLLSRGIKELCLIAQDSGSYGKDFGSDTGGGSGRDSTASLPILMEALSRLKGKFRVRLLYIHPDHFPLPILDIMEKDTRFIPYFDIPFQHGSPEILKAMNRKGNARTYLDLIKTIRGRLPDSVVRSTFLTGFPGEGEEDFAQLLDFQKKARLDWLGCFAYSREEGTVAFGIKGRVAKKTALKRKRLVEEHQVPITEKQMDRFMGRTFDVLVEEYFSPDEEEAGEESLYLGRLPCQAPEVDGAAVILSSRRLELGAMYPCRVMARAGFDLKVQIVG